MQKNSLRKTYKKEEFVSTNKFCWNCLSKAHFVKQCKSKYRRKFDKCGKLHHSLLHETEPPDKKHPQENKSQTLLLLVNSHNKSNCYLKVLPVILSNGSFKVQTNALLDSESNSTLVKILQINWDLKEKIGSCKYQMLSTIKKIIYQNLSNLTYHQTCILTTFKLHIFG